MESDAIQKEISEWHIQKGIKQICWPNKSTIKTVGHLTNHYNAPDHDFNLKKCYFN